MKKLIAPALLLLFAFPFFANAQEEVVLDSTIESETTAEVETSTLFYLWQDIREEIELFLTFNEDEKIEKRLEFADNKVEQIKGAIAQGNEELAEKLQNRYEVHMERALKVAERKQEKIQVEEKVQDMTEARNMHIEKLEEAYEQADEHGKGAIENVIQKAEEKRDEIPTRIENSQKKSGR